MSLLLGIVFTISATGLLSEKKSKELVVKEANIQFLSEAPQETIRGTVSKAEGSANLDTKRVVIRVDLNALNVPNRLMNNHMHENYLETEQHPIASFAGLITKWDLKTKTVEIEGDFSLHGITKKNFKIQGTIEEKEKDFLIRSNFEVILTDFKIEIPKLVILKLNEKIRIETSILWQSKE
ncbi:YceI family protein [Leptospira tipperaryensis]|uniref:YceI family protein n=1 Tax=Leptospira tipperaryensis TaxID=2564040 RepID=UPI001FE19E34|nr:YceI family protein [Leptospira tipperaryensis]